jgi:hypothetical protein
MEKESAMPAQAKTRHIPPYDMHDDDRRLVGYYLVRRRESVGLSVSLWLGPLGDGWYHAGIEKEMNDVIEVITRFDLEAIEMAARNQL